MNVWDSMSIEDGKYYYFQINKLHLWIKKISQEWIVGWKQETDSSDGLSMKILDTCDDDTIDWHHKVIKNNENTIKLTPLMPNRAVVVKPESVLQITAGAEALFYVSIPMWVGIVNSSVLSGLLFEIPTTRLSNTWFGEPYNGVLCYSLKTPIYNGPDTMNLQSNEILCPVQIKNTTSVDLDFTRLCIRTDFLNIYKCRDDKWTNKIHVLFRGVDKESNIIYENSYPENKRDFSLIRKARKKYSKGFTRKSFDTFNFFS